MVLSLLKSMVTSSSARRALPGGFSKVTPDGATDGATDGKHDGGDALPKVFDFNGGIHPPERKVLSNRAPLVAAPLPHEVVLPLSQHIGAPAQPLVEVGQRVRTGELIARAQGMISAPVHASITGVVTAIEKRQIPHVSGLEDLCIVITREGEIDEWVKMDAWRDWREQEGQDLIQRLQDAGVVGQGGAGFPAAVKARVRERHAIDTLIMNAAECEPYITADDLTMRTHPEALIEGLEILASLIGPECILIGIEDNKPEATIALEQAIRVRKADSRLPALDVRIEVVVVPTKYPSGGEKQLIKLLTNREVPSRGLPADVGVVVHNPGTVRAVQRAVCFGEPMISRVITLTGEALGHPHNVEARLGTAIGDLLQLAAPSSAGIGRLIMGGPMMGFTLQSDAMPIIKTTNCLLAASHDALPAPAIEQPCIRCGMCEQACPADLLPQQLYWYAKAREFDKAELYNLTDCIECGACAYVCPSQIPLVQYYRFAKGEIRSAQHEARKSERARHRFEFKQARLAREDAEKDAKRKQRTQTARAQTPGSTATSATPASSTASTVAASIAAKPSAVSSAPDLKAFKTARAAANIAVKKAEKALKSANESGEGDIAALEATATSAREKLATAEAALKTASEAIESVPVTSTAPGTPATAIANLKALKTARAAANIAVKKAEKALKIASESGEGNIAALEAAITSAHAKLASAETTLKAASEVPVTAPAPVSLPAIAGAAAPTANLKALKTARAAANISVKKAEKALARASESGEGDIEDLQTLLATAQENMRAAEVRLASAQTDDTGAGKAPERIPGQLPEAAHATEASVGRGSMASNVTLSQAEIEAARTENLAKRHKQVTIGVKAAEMAYRKAETALSSADDESRSRLETKLDRTRRNLEHARESLAEVQALVDAQ
ncbi:electron transport complex subunit RsxC [Cobetia sp. L2A1]|uniref:electron transport complex subunit RsxC n=1 Tax=Cobetia sp. L2A1 TaxID=2686360 RepID=UPI001E4FE509|nr:electron transport complex subunit RsxC [Cobetia sp. L2A1]